MDDEPPRGHSVSCCRGAKATVGHVFKWSSFPPAVTASRTGLAMVHVASEMSTGTARVPKGLEATSERAVDGACRCARPKLNSAALVSQEAPCGWRVSSAHPPSQPEVWASPPPPPTADARSLKPANFRDTPTLLSPSTLSYSAFSVHCSDSCKTSTCFCSSWTHVTSERFYKQ